MNDVCMKKANNRHVSQVGKKWGRLTAIELLSKGPIVYRFRCDCGNELDRIIWQVKHGNTSSCGCIRKDQLVKRNIETAKKGGISKLPEYSVWCKMKARCSEFTSLKDKRAYFDKGVKVCPEWQESFLSFLNYIGRRPSKNHTLDRIDPAGNYEPGNVRWATWDQQWSNLRSRKSYNGVTFSHAEVSRFLGIETSLLRYHLKTKQITAIEFLKNKGVLNEFIEVCAKRG